MTAERTTGYFPWVPGALIIAGLVHLASILLIPLVASKNAYQRLVAVTPINRLALLPQSKPGNEMLPFGDPQLATGVCRFDLRPGPLRLRAQVTGDTLVSFSFHDRFGGVFYSMTDRAALRGRIDVVVALQSQIDALENSDAEDEPAQDLRLPAASAEGFILVKALAERPGDMARARAQVESMTCATDRG